jgi:predicted metal-dependent enzyme (double-stranded beta helix superfamily)
MLAVRDLVARAVSAPDEIDTALGTANVGGFHCLHRSATLTVLQFVWPPGVELFPHDHRMWAANGIYGGREDNVLFRRTERGIERARAKRLEAKDVALLGEDAIHSVSNPLASYTAAIHVYGGDFFGVPRSQWNPQALIEAPFDVEAVRQALAAADARAHQASP